jgi:outer membrane protein insertion porin family
LTLGGALSRYIQFLSVAFASIILSLGATFAYAEGKDTIEKIEVFGNERIEYDTVKTYLNIAEGEQVDAQKIDRALKALYSTGIYADVTMHVEGKKLVVHVVENPIINRVVFEGNHKVKLEDLQGEVQLKARSVFSRSKVQSDEKRILELYRRNGRFAATVSPKVIQLPQNRVDLIFEITEGDPTYIEHINFIGNKNFTEDDLKEVLESKEEHWWRFLSSSDTYDPDRMEYDRDKLRRFYMAKGYADVKIVSAVGELSPDRQGFYMTFSIDEGERYKIGNITVKSAIRTISSDEFREKVTLVQSEDWYNSELIEKTTDMLTDFAGDQGYAFIDVKTNLNRKHDERIVDIRFDIREAPRVFIERIDIEGNDRTLDKVIRREMRLAEGDAFNASKLRRSKERIKNLDYFDKAEVTNEPSSTSPDRTVIKVSVNEKTTGEFSFGIGYSTAYGAMINAGISENNLLGTGNRASLNGSFAINQINGQLSFTNPYFLDYRLAAGFDVFSSDTNRYSAFTYSSQTTGFDLRLGFSYNEYWRQELKYTASITNVNNIQSGSSIYIYDQAGVNTLSMIGQNLTYDRRDSIITPTKGYYVSIGNEIAGLLGTEHFIRNSLSAGQYFALSDQWILSLLLQAGYMIPWDGDHIHLNNLYYLGGSTMRGFRFGGVSPRDATTGDPLGGLWDSVGSVELKLPLGLPKEYGISASLFTDVGMIGNTQVPVVAQGDPIVQSTAPRVSAGLGINWKSPMGPIAIDFSYPIVRQHFDKIQLVFLNFGRRF